MKREMRFPGALVSAYVGLVMVTLAVFGALAGRALASRGGLSRPAVQVAYTRLPLSFAKNRGQAPPGVDFVADGAGWALELGRGGVQLTLDGRRADSMLRVLTPDGRLRSPVAEQRLLGHINQFAGTDPGRWVSGAPTFARVVYRNVWSGIDLAFHGNSGALEYDFDLAPGADPGHVVLRFGGARAIRPDGRGGAVITLPSGSVRVAAPRAVQDGHAVSSRLVVSRRSIRLALGSYDHNRALVVDPSLVYSTDLGGGFAAANGIAVDASGNAYVTGNTGTQYQDGRAFVTKLSPTGRVLYSAYLGGTSSITNIGIAVDASGGAYVTGSAASTGFPTTKGAYQSRFGGGSSDAFVAHLNPSGGLVYATYLGGSGSDLGNGIAVNASGNAYVTGDTDSSDFPTSPGSYERSAAGGFVAELNPSGSALVYSTYLTVGDARAIAVDSTGAYITGDAAGSLATTPGAYQAGYAGGSFDAFVVKLNRAGSGLVYSTHLGGSQNEVGAGIAIDSRGDAFISGWTNSTNFPATRGAYETSYPGPGDDGFVAKLNPTGSALLYSTYLGGRGGNSIGGISVDSVGDAFITGETTSSDFPTTPGAYQSSYTGSGGQPNAFVTKLNPAGNALLYSTYLPQAVGSQVAIDTKGNAYVADVSYNEAWAIKMTLGEVWGLRITPTTFALAGRRVGGRCLKATRANQRRPACARPIRMRVTYQLSAPARLTIRVARMLAGRLVKLSCVKPSRKNRMGGYCVRLVLVHGALTANGHPGANSFTFNGRVGGHQLRPGRYQLEVTPSVSGQAGAPVTTTLTIAS